ncbi:hypothetical protein FPV67DRAFT_1029054 [Lyophyllum atratum]|nr:hypothetical protein FPV67DRAFT_1029054 [Lyophyllum atratum]
MATTEPAPSARDKNRQPKRRKSTTSDERKAAEADVDAVISKILAAKRAALVVSATVGPPAPGTAAVPAQKVEKKKKAKAIPPSGLEHLHAQADSDQHRALSQKADRSESPSSLEMQTPPLSSEPSAESTCPLCLLSPLHDRRACPLVLAGPESLERRLSELQEHSTDMFDNQTDMIVELQQLVTRARNGDKKGSESSGRSQRSSPQTQGSPLNARDATPEFSPNVVKEKNAVPSPLKAKAAMQNGDTNDTSSDDTSSDDSPIDTGSILPVSKDVSLVDINLDDLIRGPNIPVLRAADIPSPDSSEDEPDEVLEEDEDQPPRRSQKTGMLDSSDEDDSGVEEDVSTEGLRNGSSVLPSC